MQVIISDLVKAILVVSLVGISSGRFSDVLATEKGDVITIDGSIAAAYQVQDLSSPADSQDLGQGAVPFQLIFGHDLGENAQIHARLGFAAGNALNDVTLFSIDPWGADLEDVVTNINGRNRDYLLTATYKYTFRFSNRHNLALTGGIIDGTEYIDQNAFANDEYTQFMNGALVNGPNSFAPSYDVGGAIEWHIGGVGIHGVVMEVGQNDDGNSYTFVGLQLEYNLQVPMGEGHYRLILEDSDEAFLDPSGQNLEPRQVILFSFDQKFGEVLGLWIRNGWDSARSAVNYQRIYTGGIDIDGIWWGRDLDNIGLAYCYLNKGNLDIDSTDVFELYGIFALNEHLEITADLQYMKDTMRVGESPEGFIFGLRMATLF